ncbi:hypothetical protein LguiB_001162 [Lonicera macranthoides]
MAESLWIVAARILIILTPNYEYNVILQQFTLKIQEEDPKDKSQTQSYKFRNHNHKFEWIRKQFNSRASHLALRHNCSVEFNMVGSVTSVKLVLPRR